MGGMKNDLAQPISRARLLAQLREPHVWDVLVIGGGATGMGIAVDAAARGFDTVLVEAQDFSAGTSSRSTKLIHGGVRYLQQGNVALVREALHERALLLKNASHLVQARPFIVPCYGLFEREVMRIGLGLYDALAGKYGIGATEWLSREETLARLPGVRSEGLRGGVLYWDGQFDDAQLVVSLMRTAWAQGAVPLNYLPVVALERGADGIGVVTVRDAETGETFALRAKAVFNAAGVWVDAIRHLADPQAKRLVRVSRGSHILLDLDYMPAAAGMLIPKTRDGRVLFAIPWHGRLLVGTTDVEEQGPVFEPRASGDEIDFMIETAAGYLKKKITRADVRASFSGLRPLFNAGAAGSTAQVSREHAVIPEYGNLITITGGKWTTYRKMAIDALAAAERAGLLPVRPCTTEALALADDADWDATQLMAEALAGRGDEQVAEYARHARDYQQARTVEDVLNRRLRIGLLDEARARALEGTVRAALAGSLI